MRRNIFKMIYLLFVLYWISLLFSSHTAQQTTKNPRQSNEKKTVHIKSRLDGEQVQIEMKCLNSQTSTTLHIFM